MIEVTKDTDSLTVLGTLPPVNPAIAPAGRNTWIDGMNTQIRALAKEQQVLLADINAEFNASGSLSSLYADDVHPNDAGYQVLAQGWFKAISRARSLTAASQPEVRLPPGLSRGSGSSPAGLSSPRAAPPALALRDRLLDSFVGRLPTGRHFCHTAARGPPHRPAPAVGPARGLPDARGHPQPAQRAAAGAGHPRREPRHAGERDRAARGRGGRAGRGGRQRARRRRPEAALPARRGHRRAGGPERPADHRPPGQPRAPVPRPLGCLPPLGARGDVLSLRADPRRAPLHRRPGRGVALPARARLRARGQVLRRRGLDGRPGDPRPPPRRGRAKAPARREHQAAARADRALRHPQPRRQQPRDAERLRAGGAGRLVEHDRADPRRVGHRQGAGGPRHPLLLAAGQEALHQGELRGAAGEPGRVRAVRLRAGRLHRRPRAEEGPLRAGPRRHHLPGRDRRAHALDPGQAAAGAAGARVRAAGRSAADQGQRAAW